MSCFWLYYMLFNDGWYVTGEPDVDEDKGSLTTAAVANPPATDVKKTGTILLYEVDPVEPDASNVKILNSGTTSAGLMSGYEGAVVYETAMRAKKNPQAHGIGHEILYRNQQNMRFDNLIRQNVFKLNPKPNDPVQDIQIFRKGIQTGGVQLKDMSKSIDAAYGIGTSNVYGNTPVLYSVETAAKCNAKRDTNILKGNSVPPEFQSSGISSITTNRVKATYQGGLPTLKMMADLAKRSFIGGAAAGALFGALSAGEEILSGEIGPIDFVGRVGAETVGSGCAAAAGAVAGSVAAVAVASTVAVPAIVPVAVGVGVAMVVGTVVKSIFRLLFGGLFRPSYSY